jgi:hypothetical protein
MKLFELTHEFENIFAEIGEDGEITQEMMDNLDSIKEDFENKAISVANYIKNLQAEEEAIEKAMADMRTRKMRLTKQIQSLSDYLQFNLQKLSINEIKSSPYFKIKLKVCPPSVDVFDESLIPEEYWREKVTKSIDKFRLKEVMGEGIEIPGASIQRNIKLEIK